VEEKNMRTVNILKQQDFVEVTEVKPDAKNRVCIGRQIEVVPSATMYKVYRNSTGQIILDPQITIPASEAWVYQNKSVLRAIRNGLEDARDGRAKKSTEDFSQYISDED
jgi:hypothetical protein